MKISYSLGAGLAAFMLCAACGDDVGLNATADDTIIEANLAPSKACDFSVSGHVLPRGKFDIALGGVSGSEACDNGYTLDLRVENPNQQDVVYTSAEVSLLTANYEKILFNRDSKSPLPNPFESIIAVPGAAGSRVVVPVLAIPKAYGHQLDKFAAAGDTLTLKLVLHGQAKSGAEVESRELVYPVELCVGCMTRCLQRDIIAKDLTVDDVYGNSCRDDANADDRICVDPGC